MLLMQLDRYDKVMDFLGGNVGWMTDWKVVQNLGDQNFGLPGSQNEGE